MRQSQHTSFCMASLQYRFAKHSLDRKSFATESRELTYRGATYKTRVLSIPAEGNPVVSLDFQLMQESVAA